MPSSRNKHDCCNTDSKLLRNFGLTYFPTHFLNLNALFQRKFVLVVFFTLCAAIRILGKSMLFAGSISALLLAISHIVQACPQKQMSGVHTFPVVTSMTHQDAFWNGPKMDFVGGTMGIYPPVSFSTSPKLSVSRLVDRCLPVPAFIGEAFINFWPKSNFNRNCYTAHILIA